MKNVPHQINDLNRLRDALQVFLDLQEEGADLGDDGIVGRRMAIEGVYGFRDKSISVEDALEIERLKPKSSQGTRTFARDLRRLFSLLGFLDSETPFALTPEGTSFLSSEPGSDEEREILRRALHQLSLTDENGTSHPYRIMLRLIERVPGIETAKLALALEAVDDSEEEFGRLLRLSESESWREDLDASDHMIRNAVKILPAFARQIGEITTRDGRSFIPARPATDAAAPFERDEAPGVGPVRKHRKVSADTIAQRPVGDAEVELEREYADPAAAAAARLARLDRHNQLVRTFAEALDAAGFELTEDPYDVLGSKQGALILGEAKTLDESDVDERLQIRRAVGQLLYYGFFDVPEEGDTVLVCVLERAPSEGHQQLLQSLGIFPCWIADADVRGPDWVAERLAQFGITVVTE